MKMLNVISGMLFIVAFVPYILAITGRSVWLRKVQPIRPAKASWIIWASLDTITLAGMYAKDTVNGQILGAVLGVWIVVAFAMKYGVPGWTKLDKLCFGGAILGIVLWQVSGEANFGIVVSNVVIFLGSIPTFVSAWKDPSREDKLAWIIFWVSCVLAVIAIPHWTLADAAQPITFFAIESVMMFILFIRPRLKFAH